MTSKAGKVPTQTSRSAVDAFLNKVAATPQAPRAGERGRLIFAMDATASREPSWDRACQIQGQMFLETASLGGLDVQMAYYRGFGEFRASRWVGNSSELVREMTGVFCLGGETQIRKVLRHAIEETRKKRVNALVFVGDCCEEDVDRLCALAGELGLLNVPAFIFHEGGEPRAARAFRQIVKLTKGAYCAFDGSSARQLRDLLSAVAVYAAGGRKALESFSRRTGGEVGLLTRQIR
ncbi:MAG: VWA domain-containing protein [Alphaproteobacteria bacterium]|nr:VWA domain-containing protein [Alphaproteobacteria bacterium]